MEKTAARREAPELALLPGAADRRTIPSLDRGPPSVTTAIGKRVDLPTCRLADLPTCRLADLPTCRLADLPTCRLADLPTCRLADLPTCRLADLPTCRLADLPTCRLNYIFSVLVLHDEPLLPREAGVTIATGGTGRAAHVNWFEDQGNTSRNYTTLTTSNLVLQPRGGA